MNPDHFIILGYFSLEWGLALACPVTVPVHTLESRRAGPGPVCVRVQRPAEAPMGTIPHAHVTLRRGIRVESEGRVVACQSPTVEGVAMAPADSSEGNRVRTPHPTQKQAR